MVFVQEFGEHLRELLVSTRAASEQCLMACKSDEKVPKMHNVFPEIETTNSLGVSPPIFIAIIEGRCFCWYVVVRVLGNNILNGFQLFAAVSTHKRIDNELAFHRRGGGGRHRCAAFCFYLAAARSNVCVVGLATPPLHPRPTSSCSVDTVKSEGLCFIIFSPFLSSFSGRYRRPSTGRGLFLFRRNACCSRGGKRSCGLDCLAALTNSASAVIFLASGVVSIATITTIFMTVLFPPRLLIEAAWRCRGQCFRHSFNELPCSTAAAAASANACRCG
mmetsp:Transcript_19197/g.31661  ORF Transcript_19197/g.31661 Transcript_19197/m.31661 type:complete len:276 (+) Transcript_19197:554-1381(+)